MTFSLCPHFNPLSFIAVTESAQPQSHLLIMVSPNPGEAFLCQPLKVDWGDQYCENRRRNRQSNKHLPSTRTSLARRLTSAERHSRALLLKDRVSSSNYQKRSRKSSRTTVTGCTWAMVSKRVERSALRKSRRQEKFANNHGFDII
jgi:hypothetical protein